MTHRHMETALQDIELECAFSIFYFVGEPMSELSQHEASGDGVIGWARQRYPGMMDTMTEAVTHVVRESLEQLDAEPVELPGPPLTPEEVTMALTGLGLCHIMGVVASESPPLPAPESGVGWEAPSPNTPDGSDDFEVKP